MRPYQANTILMHDDDAMKMVRHQLERVEFDARSQITTAKPLGFDDLAESVCLRCVADDLTEQGLTAGGRDRDEVRTRLAVVVIRQT